MRCPGLAPPSPRPRRVGIEILIILMVTAPPSTTPVLSTFTARSALFSLCDTLHPLCSTPWLVSVVVEACNTCPVLGPGCPRPSPPAPEGWDKDINTNIILTIHITRNLNVFILFIIPGVFSLLTISKCSLVLLVDSCSCVRPWDLAVPRPRPRRVGIETITPLTQPMPGSS